MVSQFPPQVSLQEQATVTNAMLAWNLPRLPKFTSEKVHDEDALKSFIKEIERHSRLARLSGEVQRLQFEVHLSRKALRMYKTLKDDQRKLTKQHVIPW